MLNRRGSDRWCASSRARRSRLPVPVYWSFATFRKELPRNLRVARAGVTVRSAGQQAKKSPDRNAGYSPTAVRSIITEPGWRMERVRRCGYINGSCVAPTDILPETPPTVVGHGIIDDAMLYLTA